MKRYYPGGQTPDWHRYLIVGIAVVIALVLPWIAEVFA